MIHQFATCPHCGRVIRNLGTHEPRCPHNPVVRARTAAALADPEHPGYARSRAAYRGVTSEFDAAGVALLRDYYPTWAAVCEAFGLRVPEQGRSRRVAAREDIAIAETEEALERDAELREYWSGGRGLPVLDTPRQLPDGRVAWMVR